MHNYNDTPDPRWVSGPDYREPNADEIRVDTLLDKASDMIQHRDKYTKEAVADMLEECYDWWTTGKRHGLSYDVRDRLDATINVLEEII